MAFTDNMPRAKSLADSDLDPLLPNARLERRYLVSSECETPSDTLVGALDEDDCESMIFVNNPTYNISCGPRYSYRRRVS